MGKEADCRKGSPARTNAMAEANNVDAESMLTRARLGLCPTEAAEAEVRKYQENETAEAEQRKYQQIEKDLNMERNREALQISTSSWLATRQATKEERRVDPTLKNAEVTYKAMRSMLMQSGNELSEAQMKEHWGNLRPVETTEQGSPMPERTMVSYATMCSMLRYRGAVVSEDKLKRQWEYLQYKANEERRDEAGDEQDSPPRPMCTHCWQPSAPPGKNYLSPTAQNELLKDSCCTPCWMYHHLPRQYTRLGWDREGLHHGGECWKALLKKGSPILKFDEWELLDSSD